MFSAGLIGVVAEILMTGMLAIFIALLFSCCADVITADLTAVATFCGDDATITVGFCDDVTAVAGLITAIFCDDDTTADFGAILKMADWWVALSCLSSPVRFITVSNMKLLTMDTYTYISNPLRDHS